MQKKTAGSRVYMSRKEREQQIARRVLLGIAVLFAAGALAGNRILAHRAQARTGAARLTALGADELRVPRPQLDVELLTVNEYSRPGMALGQVRGIVIHYTANPGSSAIANRNYFEGLKDSHTTKASSHFVVGLDGEIVQCIPCSEISYASNERNSDTISIECCIEDDTGAFNQATYDSVIHLTAWLVERYQLQVTDVIRHYDVTGKNCPKYFVEHSEAWEQLRADVQTYLERAWE